MLDEPYLIEVSSIPPGGSRIARGYTRHLDEAGRYPHADALEILDDANGQGRLFHECLIPESCVQP